MSTEARERAGEIAAAVEEQMKGKFSPTDRRAVEEVLAEIIEEHEALMAGRWTLNGALARLVDVCEGRRSESHNLIVEGTTRSAQQDGIGQRMVFLEQAQAAEAQRWSALVVALAAIENKTKEV